jgi:hypothetical protein
MKTILLILLTLTAACDCTRNPALPCTAARPGPTPCERRPTAGEQVRCEDARRAGVGGW